MVDVAEVHIWGELVGAVSWNPQQTLASFEFDPKFLNNGWDLSPIKMPIANGSRIYRFTELRKAEDATDRLATHAGKRVTVSIVELAKERAETEFAAVQEKASKEKGEEIERN